MTGGCRTCVGIGIPNLHARSGDCRTLQSWRLAADAVTGQRFRYGPDLLPSRVSKRVPMTRRQHIIRTYKKLQPQCQKERSTLNEKLRPVENIFCTH